MIRWFVTSACSSPKFVLDDGRCSWNLMVIRDEKVAAPYSATSRHRLLLGGQFKVGDKVLAFFSPYGVSAVQPQAGSR